MELILLRHGKAEPHGLPGADAGRALVQKGIDQAQRAGRYLRAAGLLPEIVLTSPLLRARQTADHFCAAASLPGPVIQSWLSIGMHPDAALRELLGFQEFKRVCIIGHEPDFSSLIAWTTSSEGGAIQVRKGAIALLELHPPSRHGLLRFLLPQRMMQPLAGDADQPYTD